jgi:hypothetical protein
MPLLSLRAFVACKKDETYLVTEAIQRRIIGGSWIVTDKKWLETVVA